ncbi:ABC transporter ATP-binding protein [Roseomonas chloroacetimidivorans]|uniref:ABC transporter ATP-binding protein n=1 Tax=Roseomonas chloroacetimidivorans TaxID=1766656 RepID=UPI003C7454BA
MLRVEGLDAGYGAIQVLRGISFELRTGEVVAIIGANGAGKTTLLRTLSGLIAPMRGAIWLNGVNIAGRNCAEIVQLGLSQAPEGRRVFSGLTVEENLRLGAFRRPEKSRQVVAGAIEQVFCYFPRLRERRRQLAGTLSGGEQQMVAIGRALMADPKLLVIDELSLGLAPIIVEEILHILGDIYEAGRTIVLVEQDVPVALGFSDRALVLQSGRIVAQGPSRALLEDKQIIASYLGG